MEQTIAVNNLLNKASTLLSNKRVTKHLTYVYKKLESKDTSNLPIAAKINRKKTLAYLKEYIEQGEYPINHTSIKRHAIFRDEYGSYCAVGYLLHRYGRDDIVDEIETGNNYIYIYDITDKDYLDAITHMGITIDEAALIQPAYPWETIDTGTFSADIIQTVAIAFYVLFQFSAYMLVKRIDKPRPIKFFLFLTLFFGSSLLLTAIYAIIESSGKAWY